MSTATTKQKKKDQSNSRMKHAHAYNEAKELDQSNLRMKHAHSSNQAKISLGPVLFIDIHV